MTSASVTYGGDVRFARSAWSVFRCGGSVISRAKLAPVGHHRRNADPPAHASVGKARSGARRVRRSSSPGVRRRPRPTTRCLVARASSRRRSRARPTSRRRSPHPAAVEADRGIEQHQARDQFRPGRRQAQRDRPAERMADHHTGPPGVPEEVPPARRRWRRSSTAPTTATGRGRAGPAAGNGIVAWAPPAGAAKRLALGRDSRLRRRRTATQRALDPDQRRRRVAGRVLGLTVRRLLADCVCELDVRRRYGRRRSRRPACLRRARPLTRLR